MPDYETNATFNVSYSASETGLHGSGLDKVELTFTEEALKAAAQEALKLKTGARGLRTVIEEVLLEVMYEIPSRRDVERCVISADTILHKSGPQLVTFGERAA